MPTKIDHSLLPEVIRESVDPDILLRAQSIEWSIKRDSGENERGYVDGSHEDYLSAQNLMYKTHDLPENQDKLRQIEWFDNNNLGHQQPSRSTGGRDSGFSQHTSPSHQSMSFVDSTPDLYQDNDMDALQSTHNNASGPMKRHPVAAGGPFPIYRVNQSQLEGDVVFEAAPRARPGERTVHYEKQSRVLNEHELDALGLDPSVFGAARTQLDEQEEELIETSKMNGGSRELEDLYRQMMSNDDAGQYFERQRAYSADPSGQQIGHDEQSAERKTIIFGSLEDISNREQEFYPYRDAHQGKPLPGDNEYGTWGSRFDEAKQWKLCNGQWVRVAEPKPRPAPPPPAEEPKYEKYAAEQVKCKPPPPRKLFRVVREPSPEVESEPDVDVEQDIEEPSAAGSSSIDSDSEPDESLIETPPRRRSLDVDAEPPVDVDLDLGPPVRSRPVDMGDPVDIEALKDKYRPKAEAPADERPTRRAPATRPKPEAPQVTREPANTDPPSPGTIMLEPPPAPPQEIKVEPIQPVYVEMKKPLKDPEGEEEKMMEDPNLLWMHMGPAQYGPPFGSMKKRKGAEEDWVGPPCELCHKQIEERRCMLAENMKFHCWHFACSFCLKVLKPADFLIAEADKKPYCLNCHKREFPEIPLASLKLEE